MIVVYAPTVERSVPVTFVPRSDLRSLEYKKKTRGRREDRGERREERGGVKQEKQMSQTGGDERI